MTVKPLTSLQFNMPQFHGIQERVAVSATATTDVPEVVIFTDTRSALSDGPSVVATVKLTPDVGSVAVPTGGTNFWTATVTRYTNTGVLVGVVASLSSVAAGFTAGTTTSAFGLTQANVALSPGDFLTYKAVHSGTPTVVMPAGNLTIDTNRW